MHILLDIGNTRMKTSIADADGIRPIDAWQEYIDKADDVLVSNVAGQDALPMILQGNPKCKVLTRDSDEARAWLKQIPSGMGADRVAADIGARSIYADRPLLVIDAGTCITFDVIDTDGTILGGAISPGIHLRLKAMHEHTAALPLLGIDGEHPVMGYNTETAMRSGAINGVRWEIEGYIRHILALRPQLHVFFTGGDSTQFPLDLQQIITVDPLLVQRGLLAAFTHKDVCQ